LAIRKHTGGEPKTLDEYRQRYALYKSDPHLQAAHAAHPWLLMWDDHEVVNDYAADRDTRNTPLEVFMQRRAAAYQAYFEHQPLALGPDPSSPWGASMRLHQHLPWGRLADLWTLDCRQYRSPQACPDPNRGGGRVVTQCAELDEPGRSMLGAAQEDWLYQGLRQSSATWKLLAQATQISPTSVSTPLGRATYTDAWDGYPQARRRLLQAMADGPVSNVLTLGGDVHMNVAAKLRLQPNDDNSPVVASEFVATSITSRGLGESVLNAARSANPDIVYARSDERGYALIHIEPESALCEFRTTPFPAGTRADLTVQARFQVERGRGGPVKL
jgi:alkaline phosphatase D